MSEAPSLIYDLLNRLPLEMAFIWLILLFFAGKFSHLGLLGLYGRGVPVLNSRTRWAGLFSRLFSYLLVATGATIAVGFVYWLVHAVLVRML